LLSCSVIVVRGLAPTTKRASICNGHAEFCDKSYGEVTFVGAHDSYAVQQGEFNFADNQDQNITTQLNDGVRMLQVQAHLQNGDIRLCHTSCTLYDGGTLENYLKTVKTWMDSNPNDVVSLLIVNNDNAPPTQYDTIFKSAGVDTVSFAPATTPLQASAWPTLGSMIDSGKRLVTFLDNQANTSVVPYIIDEFTNIWETSFDVTGTFDCSVNRTHGDPTTQMYLINHFLDQLVLNQPAPDVNAANVTNAASGAGSLGEQVNTCVTANSRPPNFLLVDFYEFGGGSVFQVAASINNVTYAPSTPIAQPLPKTTNGSSSPSGSSQNNGALSVDLNLDVYITQLSLLFASIVFGALAIV